jgi:hypothetical protein
MRSSQKNQCFFMEAQRMLSKSFLAWTLHSKRRTVSVLISSTFCDSIFVNFFLTSVVLNQRLLSLPGFHGIGVQIIGAGKVKLINTCYQFLTASWTGENLVSHWTTLWVPGTCVIKKEDYICSCFFTLLKIRATAPCACYFIHGLFNVEVITSDSVLSNGNVIR